MLSCRTFSVGGTVVRSREVSLPYRTADDGDTDDVGGAVVRHCAANGGRSVAVAVNFNDRVSRLPSAVLLLVLPDSKSVIQTDFLLQVGAYIFRYIGVLSHLIFRSKSIGRSKSCKSLGPK